MADGLTDAAKAEIAEAIRIVREDKFENHIRGVFSKYLPAEKDDPKDELIAPEKEKETATPPPAKDEKIEKDKPVDEPAKRKSSYWGEILDD